MSIALLRDMAFGLTLPRYAMATPSEGVTDSLFIGRPLVSFGAQSKCKKKLTLSKSRSVVFSNMGDSKDTVADLVDSSSSSSSSSRLRVEEDELNEARKSLSEARAKQEATEKERDRLLEELALSDAKQKEYNSTIRQHKESAISELEAAKSLFDRKLQESVEERFSLETKLVLAKQDAVELAVQVEKLAEIAFRQATSRILEDAELRVSAAETSAAEAALEVDKQIKDAVEGTLASVLNRSRDAIEKALDAAERAGSSPVEDLFSCIYSENTKLKSVVADLEYRLSALRNEVDLLRLELEQSEARAKAFEARANDAEMALVQFRDSSKEKALHQEVEVKSMMERMERDAEERNKVAAKAFEEELRSISSAIEAAREVAYSKDNAFLKRCEALQRSLEASEEVSKVWRQRADLAESLLFKENPSIEAENDSICVVNGGRLDLLSGDDSMKWKLLSEGPRREIPQWRARRIRTIRPKFPPRKTDVTEALSSKFRTLELPKVDEVWSVAKEKLREGDAIIERVIEKETIEKKRKALERALQEKSVQRKRAPEQLEPGTGTGREIVFQAFNWESWRKPWYRDLASKAADLSQSGVTAVWLPPPTESVAPQGYMPSDLYNLNSAYGTVEELKQCIEEMHSQDILALGDVVLNHRCAHKQSSNGVWNIFGGKLSWGPEAIVCDDPNFQGRGNPSSGDIFHAAPNIDHSQDFVRKDIKEWLNWLRNDIGFDGWRLDFVRGFSGTYVKEYIEASNPAFAIGEYWDSLGYEHGNMCYNQDAHRQRIINWINAAGGTSSAFDVTTKGILHSALHNEYWRLIDPQGKPTGVMGWWPSRAVTFLENHDTGSTQGHWPFPRDKLAQGYAYILTHPGTPVIFYDHFYDFGIRDIINELIEARRRAGIHCRSTVKICHANNEGYVAQIGDTLVMKLGHFDWNPSKENSLEGSWQKFVDKGSDYQLWLRQ